MLFLVPDEKGQIVQANKVFDPEGYSDRMNELEIKHIAIQHAGLLPPELWHIPDGVLTERPEMKDVTVSKNTIKAGANDKTEILGAPKNTAFTVSVQGHMIWEGTLPDGELELSVPTPGLYLVVLDIWPYQTCSIRIEAVA